MASAKYNIMKSRMMKADLDLDEGVDDVRAILVMTNTTADTEIDVDNTGSITTLDEMDGSGYARQNCANQVVATDDANDRAEFSCDAMVWATLGNGTRQVQGVYFHEFITNDAGSFCMFFSEFSATINPGGSTLTVTPNAEGLYQIS